MNWNAKFFIFEDYGGGEANMEMVETAKEVRDKLVAMIKGMTVIEAKKALDRIQVIEGNRLALSIKGVIESADLEIGGK